MPRRAKDTRLTKTVPGSPLPSTYAQIYDILGRGPDRIRGGNIRDSV